MTCCPVHATMNLLTLPILSRFAGSQKTIFLALLDASIARQKPGPFQDGLVLRILLNQRPGNSVPNGLGLTIKPSACHADNSIEYRRSAHRSESSHCLHGHGLHRKIDLDRLAIDNNLTRSSNEMNTSYCSFSLARSPNLSGRHGTLPS